MASVNQQRMFVEEYMPSFGIENLWSSSANPQNIRRQKNMPSTPRRQNAAQGSLNQNSQYATPMCRSFVPTNSLQLSFPKAMIKSSTSLVGSCYVHKMISGEVIDYQSVEKRPRTVFEIRRINASPSMRLDVASSSVVCPLPVTQRVLLLIEMDVFLGDCCQGYETSKIQTPYTDISFWIETRTESPRLGIGVIKSYLRKASDWLLNFLGRDSLRAQ
jgi:hypothetical protein